MRVSIFGQGSPLAKTIHGLLTGRKLVATMEGCSRNVGVVVTTSVAFELWEEQDREPVLE